MTQVGQVAKYILALSSPEIGDIISNMKLQKLLYYAQGLYLAKYGEPLFEDEIEAWDYGPVVKSVYHDYKSFGAGAIFIPLADRGKGLSKRVRKLLSAVYIALGQYSASKLMHMTHSEAPWKQTYTSKTKVISVDSMRNFFTDSVLVREVFQSKKERLKVAVELLLSDYENDKELTDLTLIDSDDFYEE